MDAIYLPFVFLLKNLGFPIHLHVATSSIGLDRRVTAGGPTYLELGSSVQETVEDALDAHTFTEHTCCWEKTTKETYVLQVDTTIAGA